MKELWTEFLNALLALAGYFCIGYGCWMIWHPLAYLWAGILLCSVASGASGGKGADK